MRSERLIRKTFQKQKLSLWVYFQPNQFTTRRFLKINYAHLQPKMIEHTTNTPVKVIRYVPNVDGHVEIWPPVKVFGINTCGK